MVTIRKPVGGATKSAAVTHVNARKTRVPQSLVPKYGIKEALKISQAFADNFACAPTKPLNVAAALNLALNSSHFRMLLGASAAYDLTKGAWDSDLVSLNPLGKRIVVPSSEEDKNAALREAFLKPRAVGDFLRKYANSRFPKDNNISRQVLEDMGVPADSSEAALKLIVAGANWLGILRQVKDSLYVDLDPMPSAAADADGADDEQGDPREAESIPDGNGKADAVIKIAPTQPLQSTPTNNKVFITHGKNLEIVSQLKELLVFGKFNPVVAQEHETISKPVPDKIMDEMRSCSAAIIHVGKEIKVLDESGKEHVFLNQNVLIEIGAAMALYGRKFILLVERGASFPSNLQGLYEVRYEGNKLDYEATMKLLKAFNDFRQ